MKHKLILFVLIVLMIKTNVKGQTFYYYFKGEKIPVTINEDKLLVRIQNPTDRSAHSRFLTKANADRDFELSAQIDINENREYYILNRVAGSSKNVADEIAYYNNEDYISSITTTYKAMDNAIIGVSNEIIVKFKDDGSIEKIKELLAGIEYISVEQNKYNKKKYSIFLSKNATNIFQVADMLYESGFFEVAVPNFFVHVKTACNTSMPTDPLASNQWALNDINICPAWDIASASSNSPAVVAVIDVGVDATHEDLQGRVITGLSGQDLESSTSPNPRTEDFHGTAMAGIIAANNNNNKDIAGATETTKILPIRAFLGNFNDLDDSHISDAISNVLSIASSASLNVGVINLSFEMADMQGNSTPSLFPLTENEIQVAFAAGRNNFGIVIVAAAGNDAVNQLPYPANSMEALAVTASTTADDFASSYPSGGGSNFGTGVGVSAPGVGIVSLNVMGNTSLPNSLSVTNFPNALVGDGNSSSAAYVSSVAALLLQINPCLTAPEVNAIIEATANKTGTTSYSVNAQWGSWNNKMGYGRINAGNAAILAQNMYKQNLTDYSSYTYRSINDIFAGNNVTTIFPTGKYIAAANSDIHFYAYRSINLEAGFETQLQTVFDAEISNSYCGQNWNTHWKPANTNDSNLNNEQNNLNNYSAQQPLSSFNSNSNVVTIYPNPTSGISYLSYQISTTSAIEIKLTNSVGQDLSYLIQPYEKNPTAGSYKVPINSDQLAPGVYYCSISLLGGQIITKKLTVY